MKEPHAAAEAALRALYPAIAERDGAAAYENLRSYATLAADVMRANAASNLTDRSMDGTVSLGQVDPISNLINTG